MRVVVWVVEGTWESCVDAARAYTPAAAEIVLLHVVPAEVEEAAHGAFAGLLGRARHDDPTGRLAELSRAAGAVLLSAAERRLARPAVRRERRGRVEREVGAALAGADLLVAARDGDRGRLGPRSLGPATRFVVDHAPCAVLLVWPQPPPDLSSLPPPPPPPPRPRR